MMKLGTMKSQKLPKKVALGGFSGLFVSEAEAEEEMRAALVHQNLYSNPEFSNFV